MIKSSGEEEKFVHIFSFAIYKFLERSEGGGGQKHSKVQIAKETSYIDSISRQFFHSKFMLLRC